MRNLSRVVSFHTLQRSSFPGTESTLSCGVQDSPIQSPQCESAGRKIYRPALKHIFIVALVLSIFCLGEMLPVKSLTTDVLCYTHRTTKLQAPATHKLVNTQLELLV